MMSQRARASLVSYQARCSLSLTLGPLHFQPAENTDIKCSYQARALRALGLLLADGTPTVGGGKTF